MKKGCLANMAAKKKSSIGIYIINPARALALEFTLYAYEALNTSK